MPPPLNQVATLYSILLLVQTWKLVICQDNTFIVIKTGKWDGNLLISCLLFTFVFTIGSKISDGQAVFGARQIRKTIERRPQDVQVLIVCLRLGDIPTKFKRAKKDAIKAEAIR